MDEMNQTPQSIAPPPYQPEAPVPPAASPEQPKNILYPAGKREFVFGLLILIIGWLLCNSVFFAGFNLGFAIFTGTVILCTAAYLLVSGSKLKPYSCALLLMSLVIAASFARSDDGFVKFIMVLFLIIAVNLGLCLLAGQQRWSAKGLLSLLNIPRTAFVLGVGKFPKALFGLFRGLRNSGAAGRKGGAIALGLVIAVPLVAILIPLLISADAAFDALLQQLPDWDLGEILASVFLGTLLAVFFYSRGAALWHAPRSTPKEATARKGMSPLTVNTVLIAVGVVYVVYLVSQLAYFSGGFSGILPEGYTMAEYARRGFFEMAWLCAINLGIISLAVGVVAKKKSAPLLTRLICLFIGIVTLFLVVSASAKMFMYIESFGLTRLRVLTEVIMLWLGIATLVVSVWLFIPKLPYMKAVLLIALVMGAAVSWADVDTVVAGYNVTAYQNGVLDTVDVEYLESLGDGAIPYIAQLTEDADPDVAEAALLAIDHHYYEPIEDFRDWNYVNQQANFFDPEPEEAESADDLMWSYIR